MHKKQMSGIYFINASIALDRHNFTIASLMSTHEELEIGQSKS